MGYSEDLLEQANHLARRESKRPRQASLRRAVSSAYYALFHFLIWSAADCFAPNEPKELRHVWKRAFAHGEMKEACKAFASKSLPSKIKPFVGTNEISRDLIAVAIAFVDLQEARHSADYDLSQAFLRQDAINQIKKAEDAVAAWERIRKSPESKVFLSALLLWKRWPK